MLRPACLALVCSLLAAYLCHAAPADAEKLFTEQVMPLLKQKCFACHGDEPKKLRGDFDLRSRLTMLKGGKSGKAAIVPGEPAKSPLFVAVERRNPDLAMPPKENDKLDAAQVELLRRWIAAGAPWPEAKPTTWDNNPNGIHVTTSGGQSPEWTNRKYDPADLWAYQPVRRSAVPEIRNPKTEIRNPLDAFLLEKQVAKGISQGAGPADRRTLLRRLTVDLTGLPPTPAELDAFLKDNTADAFVNVVARLLKSPHYGEQQARHWLDVVRYADTAGFANDFERPAAWRYRDYVVRSFNGDKRYDRFIVEQLAGDELEPNNPEMLLATGFLRMGPWEQTGMSVAALTRQQFLDDVTHAVGVTFLAQGLRCASCHDHKFDPVPTRDYYRLQAVFAATQFAERPAAFLPSENIAGFAESKAVVEERLKKATAERERLQKKSDDAIAAYLKERGIVRLTDIPEAQRPKKARFGLNDLELSLIRINQKRIEHFERELLRYEPYAFSIYNGPPANYLSNKPLNVMPARREGALAAVHILPGGALDAPAEAVTPGVLSAAAGAPSAWPTLPETRDSRRLALANWIASPSNPLTARAIVNRLWQQHFGKGLVATPNNFGKMGRKPTHPELLDWLAVWFVEHGWSIKQLHQLIVSSAAYQQAGDHPERALLERVDPNNDLLAYFPSRRLAAEEIRDSLLHITGELNPAVGGPGVFPELNWEVALQPRHTMGSVAPAYVPSLTPTQRNRRTLYAFRTRTLADPLQEVFNRPGSETSCERRDATTVTPQAFALFNSEFSHARALALAARLEKTSKESDERIQQAFRLCYGRAATADEAKMCVEHLTKLTAYHRDHPPKPTELPTRVTRKMIEEMTGEEYSWEEELDGMKNYQRDLQAWQVGPETRALADLCLVLFNSNEFLYVR